MPKALDLIGKTFGNLCVESHTGESDPSQGRMYLCKCGCGKLKVVSTHQLTYGSVRSCGCWKSRIVEIGKKYGLLTAIARAGHIGKDPSFLFKCDCGTEKVIGGGSVKRGHVKSCGCFRKEYCREISSLSPGRDGKSYLRQQFWMYINNAKRKGREFALTREQFEGIVSRNCFYCGAPPKPHTRPRCASYSMNGIDRMNNLHGYTPENCVPCCTTCNVAKASMGREEFTEWVSKVYKNLVK